MFYDPVNHFLIEKKPKVLLLLRKQLETNLFANKLEEASSSAVTASEEQKSKDRIIFNKHNFTYSVENFFEVSTYPH